MTYFLFKTEPDVYSFDDFLRDKETVWDGVTNAAAVKHLREMEAEPSGFSTTPGASARRSEREPW